MSNLDKRITQLEDKRPVQSLPVPIEPPFDSERAGRILQQLMDLGTHPDMVSPAEWATINNEANRHE